MAQKELNMSIGILGAGTQIYPRFWTVFYSVVWNLTGIGRKGLHSVSLITVAHCRDLLRMTICWKASGVAWWSCSPRDVPWVPTLYPRELIDGKQANPLPHLQPDPRPSALGKRLRTLGNSLGNRFTTQHPWLFHRLSQTKTCTVNIMTAFIT